jgi:hypothetical protein
MFNRNKIVWLEEIGKPNLIEQKTSTALKSKAKKSKKNN